MRYTVLFTVVILAGYACGRPLDIADTTSSPRMVHAGLVEKSAKLAYFNRLATPTKHLVVGPTQSAEAVEQAEIAVSDDERLFIVEGQPLPFAKLPGEKARLERFAIVAVPATASPHAFIGTHQFYMEAVADQLSADDETADLAGDPTYLRRQLEMFFEGEKPDSQQSQLGPIQQDELVTWVKELSGEIPVTIGNRKLRLADRRSAEGREDARVYLRREYEALGFTVRDEAYRSGFSRGVNFVATRPAASAGGGVVILSSHLDSVGNAGADDNAAGTIAVLAAAKALKDIPLRHELRVVAFDQEEDGLLGSAAYVRQLRERGEIDQVVANLNVEMPGYDADDDGKVHVIDCNENTSSEITRRARRALANLEPPLMIEPACTNRSDHASFWRAGRPAVVVSQNFFGGDSNPCYHAACDRVDGMHFGYMHRVTTMVAKTAEALTAAQN